MALKQEQRFNESQLVVGKVGLPPLFLPQISTWRGNLRTGWAENKAESLFKRLESWDAGAFSGFSKLRHLNHSF